MAALTEVLGNVEAPPIRIQKFESRSEGLGRLNWGGAYELQLERGSRSFAGGTSATIH